MLLLQWIQCHGTEDWTGADEPYLLVCGRKVWTQVPSAIQYRLPSFPLRYDQDFGLWDDDDYLGSWIVRGVRTRRVKKKRALTGMAQSARFCKSSFLRAYPLACQPLSFASSAIQFGSMPRRERCKMKVAIVGGKPFGYRLTSTDSVALSSPSGLWDPRLADSAIADRVVAPFSERGRCGH